MSTNLKEQLPPPPAEIVLDVEPRYLDAARRMALIHLGATAGVVYWKPAGLRLYEKLKTYVRNIHQAHGYLEVKTPSLVGLPVFERSGHLGKYRENMFLTNQVNDLEQAPDLALYALRPMSCPGHIEVYASETRSYRDLPLALFEFGEVFRNEPSGSLQVLFRQRQFTQDDSHVFVRQDQVVDSISNYLAMSLKAYRELGFENVEVSISLRPEQRFGTDADWDEAEEGCREACRQSGLAWQEQDGGGAFYGPKVELGVRDKLGRLWQMGVIQLDRVLAGRFDIAYIAEDGSKVHPVILHHAVLGSLERMIGTLLETHGVALAPQLHPYPLVLVPVTQAHLSWAKAVAAALAAQDVECIVETANDTVPAKVRGWKVKGALRIVVIGDKELAAHANAQDYAQVLQG